MGHMGIQIAQEGISIERAADYQKVLDDRWPFMDIEVEKTIDWTRTVWPTDTGYWLEELAEHNLNYLPAFTSRMTVVSGLSNPRDIANEVIATNKKIYLRGLYFVGDPTTPLTLRFTIRVLTVDITREFRQEVVRTSLDPKTSASTYGVRVLGERGGELSDEDMTKFNLHNNAKALAVQQTGTRTPNSGNGFGIIVDHNLGYPPTFFYARYYTPADWTFFHPNPLPDDTIITPINLSPSGLATSSTTRLSIFGAQSVLQGNYAFLIVKDPLEVAA